MAAKAKKLDRKALAKAKQQEARIQKLIQEAIRKARERARERARRAAAAAAAKANHGGAPIDTNGLLMRPVNGPVTSPYGYRVHPIYHYWGLHDGTDFGVSCGAPLAAVRNGKVLTEYYSSVYGNRLYLNVGQVNGKFITVVYNHLSRVRRRHRRPSSTAARSSGTSAPPAGRPAATSTSRCWRTARPSTR